MVKAPIKWFGGKGTLVKKILEYTPKEFNTYCEPFGGSGVMLLNVSCPIKIYNDLNLNLYSLYTVLQDKKSKDEIVERCQLSIYHESFRDQYKEALKGNDLTNLDRAYYFWYVNRTSIDGHGGFSCNRLVRRNISYSNSAFLGSIDNLETIHKLLQQVIIFNRDAFEIIDKFDENGTFFYIDPPYVLSTRTNHRYDHDMDDSDQTKLIDRLLKCKAKVLLSGYLNDLYTKLECNGWNRFDIPTKIVGGGADGSKVKNESLWMNY